ncbi:ribonuclease domain-containing protein [Paenibacillus xylaniclasticus]|uniref:ribonuclease domain-containing protein n=1 Tax=Paenibacillus xylaniclasticus TaxID=588083 RepID=UPI001771C04E|nr:MULTISPECIES: ribonuclease domain-containing protein [Paenibacillus]GFN32149.1 hypothetical protein PCURB6_24090 [Paenibacillus curdlanolyticus]
MDKLAKVAKGAKFVEEASGGVRVVQKAAKDRVHAPSTRPNSSDMNGPGQAKPSGSLETAQPGKPLESPNSRGAPDPNNRRPDDEIRRRVLDNIDKSKAARDSSNYDKYLIKEKELVKELERKKALEGTGKALTSADDVAGYIRKNGKLPDNFITKKEAEALGWNPKKGNLNDVAPGKSIGGDVFKNKGNPLPDAPGRVWYEADINYSSGFRGNERIIYSNDGLIYKTTDHYKTFTQIK